MHEVARLAVLDRVSNAEQDQRRREFVANELPRWRPVIDRLADS